MGATDAIYLDNQATTPTDRRVLESMLPLLEAGGVGNPHSQHFAGQQAAEAVERARSQIAELVGAVPEEIVFTSGATEANNIAILGIAGAAGRRGDHVVTCATEHSCVLQTALSLRERGFDVDVLPVDGSGLVDVARLASLITERTALVSVMTANNEIGVLQPISEIATICRSHGIPFHTDAAQAAGKIPIDVVASGVDVMSLSGHKIYAPIGIGALFVAEDCPVRPEPVFRGGSQERGLRPGTVPAHLAVAMGAAAELARRRLGADADHCSRLRARFLEVVMPAFADAFVNGAAAPRLPGSLSLTIPGVDADHLVGALQPRVAISTSAACSSGTIEASHVLRAIGLGERDAKSTVRIGFGRQNTIEQAETAAVLLRDAAEKIRGNAVSSDAAA
ncbi:cysteine desulfurase family protein [Bradyrhizobium sp. SZCCHNRI20481]|uniref:cysteine desulfurase family protein n=1 Tax=Bradyrhizobium sp. SZCCHNRI20481 TaxID=3057286 RepID=UPI0029166A0F|nr:cysteine desulfurase family protein [Bradyrhizobium sp. SZCCHNRI20481]